MKSQRHLSLWFNIISYESTRFKIVICPAHYFDEKSADALGQVKHNIQRISNWLSMIWKSCTCVMLVNAGIRLFELFPNIWWTEKIDLSGIDERRSFLKFLMEETVGGLVLPKIKRGNRIGDCHPFEERNFFFVKIPLCAGIEFVTKWLEGRNSTSKYAA